MELDFALLADAAAAPPDGKLYLMGGGIETIVSRKFPCFHTHLALVMRFVFTPMDAGAVHKIKVNLIDEDGRDVLPPLELNLPVPQEFHKLRKMGAAVVGNLQNLKFEKPGDYRFDISLDGRIIKSIPLTVLEHKE